MDFSPLLFAIKRKAAHADGGALKGIYFRGRPNIFAPGADVAELADALDSKSGIREDVWVRPPPSAPSKSHRL